MIGVPSVTVPAGPLKELLPKLPKTATSLSALFQAASAAPFHHCKEVVSQKPSPSVTVPTLVAAAEESQIKSAA